MVIISTKLKVFKITLQESKLCAHPMIEIYEKDQIVFMAPLSRQDEFYVEETQEPDLTSSTIDESENQGIPSFDYY